MGHGLQDNLWFGKSIDFQWIETGGDKNGSSIDRGEECGDVDAVRVRWLSVDIVEDQ